MTLTSRTSEYIRFIDGAAVPTFLTTWTLRSPDTTYWSATVSTSGIVTYTSGAAPGTTPVFVGLNGNAWDPTIDNGGVVTVTNGAPLDSYDLAAALIDSGGSQWNLYVDANSLVNVTTNLILPTAFRYPSVIASWTPTAATDQFIIYSLRASITVRRLDS